MENLYRNFEFYWWVGVVEDRNDPMFLGRCKVRIVGYHTSDKSELPISDLPWAYPIQPITSAAMSGKGHSPIGPVEGTWVVGFFRDGEDCQEPVILGTMGGVPGKEYYTNLRNASNQGFQDPAQTYPLSDYLNDSEPDTNRLARNQSISKTIIKTKDDARNKSVETAIEKTTWDQPLTPYNALYPHNHVFESEAGHTIEIDDTPNNERVAIYHKAGTYLDVDVNGTMVKKIVGDSYEIYLRHNNVLIKGNANVTIEGNSNIYVKNNCNLEVDGDLNTHVHGDYNLNVAGDINVTSGKNTTLVSNEDMFASAKQSMEVVSGDGMKITSKSGMDVKSDASMGIEAGSSLDVKSGTTLAIGSGTTTNFKAGTNLNIMGTIKTSIGSPITEVALIKMNAFTISPTPPPATATSPNGSSGASLKSSEAVSELSPTLPTFSDLVVPNREEVLTFTLDVLGEDFQANAAVIKSLLNEAIAEGVITQEELDAPVTESARDEEPAPEKPQVIPGCGDINNLPTISDSLKISKHFTIASLTSSTAFPVRLAPSQGLSEREIACNLKALAEQVLDPIKDKYPNMIITSGFRNYVPEGGSTTSQHLRGQAADLQFPGMSKSQYYEIAQWIKQHVPYDQMLLEYKTTGSRLPWIHVTFNRNGCRNVCSTFMNHSTAPNGRGVLLQLA